MHSSQNHIINKVFVKVNTTNEKTAYQIQSTISTFLNAEVFPKLETLLDKYDVNGHTFRFDRLDVNFNLQDWTNIDEFKFEFLSKVEQTISESISGTTIKPGFDNSPIENEFNKSIVQVREEENYQKTFLFFLENGFLPWFGKEKYIAELTAPKQWQESLTQSQFSSALKAFFRENKRALERFLLQFSDEQIMIFIESFDLLKIKNTVDFLGFIHDLAQDSRNAFLKLLITIGLYKAENRLEFIEFVRLQLSEKKTHEITKQVVLDWNKELVNRVQHLLVIESNSDYFRLSKEELIEIVKDNDTSFTVTRKETKELNGWHTEDIPNIQSEEFWGKQTENHTPFFEDNQKEIFVQNAGLILFHPFLKTLFTQFEWLNEKGQIITEHRFKAVQSLHYCATGGENYFEGNLLFEKFLCNAPLAMPIPSRSLLNGRVKKEIDEMATALLEHWPALRSTSVEALRETFIQRNGKLQKTDSGFRLIVERKTLDILLEKLQWNISIVKLPWKDDLLFIDW